VNDALPLLPAERASDATATVDVEAFVRAYQPTVFKFALSIMDDAVDAEDAAQEALVAASRNLSRYRGESAFTTWLYTITLNACRKILQKRRSTDRLLGALRSLLHLRAEQMERPEETALRYEAKAEVLRAVHGLDEKHRLPVILRYYHDLPVAEIAKILQINEGTVHSRLFTARERLRLTLNLSLGETPAE
jgi:RNA polymerase sigma-70 factor (ECF subfamily)